MKISPSLNPENIMFSFKDVIITNREPALFPYESRTEIRIFDKLDGFKNREGGVNFIPIIPAPMSGLLNYVEYIEHIRYIFRKPEDVYIVIAIPRFPYPDIVMTPNTRMAFVELYHKMYKDVIVASAAGISSDTENKFVKELISFYYDNPDYLGILVYDVSNGYHEKLLNKVKETLPILPPNMMIMYGNFMGIPPYTHPSLLYRFGIGGGRVCSTRLKSSTGSPSLWAALRSLMYGASGFEIKGNPNFILDGGISQPSYIPIALTCGTPMIGSLFLSTEMNLLDASQILGSVKPGVIPHEDLLQERASEFINVLTNNLRILKEKLAGNQLELKNIDFPSKRLIVGSSLFSSNGLSTFPEGVVKVVKTKPISQVLQDIWHAIITSFSLVGAKDIDSFRKNAMLIKVSDGEWKDRDYNDK